LPQEQWDGVKFFLKGWTEEHKAPKMRCGRERLLSTRHALPNKFTAHVSGRNSAQLRHFANHIGCITNHVPMSVAGEFRKEKA
jgi:hypothetical protein